MVGDSRKTSVLGDSSKTSIQCDSCMDNDKLLAQIKGICWDINSINLYSY